MIFMFSQQQCERVSKEEHNDHGHRTATTTALVLDQAASATSQFHHYSLWLLRWHMSRIGRHLLGVINATKECIIRRLTLPGRECDDRGGPQYCQSELFEYLSAVYAVRPDYAG